MHPRRVLKSHFSNIIYTIPKSIVEIHEVKKTTKEEEEVPKPMISKTHHVLFQFPVKPDPEPESEPIMEEDNSVEYIVDIGEVYTIDEETEKNEYNPMYFSLRHYISGK
jgi:hypothetical protein